MDPITRKEMFLAKAAGQNVTTPKPITREEMFLAKIAENGGASSWNDLTDKPFGESENAVLLPPTQFAYDSTFGLFAVVGYIDFVLGKTYTVKWNGVDYETTAVAGAFNGESLVMIGNPAALGGANNNMPFAVACLMGSIGAIPLDGSTAVNVGISGYAITKIPVQYLPRMIVYVETAAKPNGTNDDMVYGDDKLTILTPGVKWTDIYAAVVSDIEVIIRVQNPGEKDYVNYRPNWVRKDSNAVSFYTFGKNDYIMIVGNSCIYTKLT